MTSKPDAKTFMDRVIQIERERKEREACWLEAIEAQMIRAASVQPTIIGVDVGVTTMNPQAYWVTANTVQIGTLSGPTGASLIGATGAQFVGYGAVPEAAPAPPPGPRKPAPALCVEAHRSEPIDADRARAATLAMCRAV